MVKGEGPAIGSISGRPTRASGCGSTIGWRSSPTTRGTQTISYVAFTDTKHLIVDAAKNQVAMNPTNTIFDAKHLIFAGVL